MNNKVQLNDMELNQVTGGSLKSIWEKVKKFFNDAINDPTTIVFKPESSPLFPTKPSPLFPKGPIFNK